MDIKATFRKLVTNQYMPDFDYNWTKFAFETVCYENANTYCICNCGFQHEYLEYILGSGDIDENVYDKILNCILAGKCPHVDEKPKDYVKESSVYGIHIAAAVGTNAALVNALFRTDEKTSGLYNLNPEEIALIKNPNVVYKFTSVKRNLSKGITILNARKTNKNVNTFGVQSKEETIVEYCARKGEITALNLNNETTFSGKDFVSTLHVALKYELLDLQKLLKRGWCRLHDIHDTLEECCVLTIVYDKPELLHFLLHQVQLRTRVVPNKSNMAINLNLLCDALQRRNCKQILSIKQNFLNTHIYNESIPTTISRVDAVTLLITLLFKYDIKDEIRPFLCAIPNISELLNIIGGDYGTCLHTYNCSSGKYDLQLLKMFLALGADVNRADSNGMTPLIHLLSMQELCLSAVFRSWEKQWRSTFFRDTEELYIYENPDIHAHRSLLLRGLRVDKAFYNIKLNDLPRRIGEQKVYLMDCREHGSQGHDKDDMALNFMVPFLIECGFPILEDFLEEFAKVEDLLDPVEQLYIHQSLSAPRSLLLKCRDRLRSHYSGRKIHKFLKVANVPKTVKDFILLKPLLKCVPRRLLY